MAQFSALRQLVSARSGGACEYCRLLEAPTGVTFHLDHVIPRRLGGKTVLSNLALSCPGCNLGKGQRLAFPDAAGLLIQLFNPRRYNPWLLGWHLHFVLDLASGLIVSRTATGEATIDALGMNGEQRTWARRLQIQAGLLA